MIARVLVIAGSDSGGGAGVQADLKTVSALGAFATTAITALTAQNTRGVFGVLEVSAEFVKRQIEVVVDDIGCDAVKTGMLSSAAIVEAVAETLGRLRPGPLVVDPVMISKSGAPLLLADAVETLRRRLLPLATVVTPNLAEAEALVGREVRSLEQMREAARAIAGLGARNVVVKGGHLTGPAIDLFYDGERFHEIRGDRIATTDTHGTGCIFASAIATHLALGRSLDEAVEGAKEFVTAAIRGGLRFGEGSGPANPLAAVRLPR